MRKIVNIEKLISKENFIPWFIMNSFPEGIDEENDLSIYDVIEENYSFDMEWYNNFTNYYEDVFMENDGYVENPNSILLELLNSNELIIEFHPGDVLFFLNGIQIGCTGPDYKIKVISFNEYSHLTKELSIEMKIFLLPMVKIIEEERDMFKNMVNIIISKCNISKKCEHQIVEIIVNNCLRLE